MTMGGARRVETSGFWYQSLPMTIRLSHHMREQLALRPELRQEWIAAAITTPDWTLADPDPTLTRSYKASQTYLKFPA